MTAGQSTNSLAVNVHKLPAIYDPKTIEDAFRALLTAMNAGFSCVTFQERHVEPSKTDPHMMMVADGTNWDPAGVGGPQIVIRNAANGNWRYVFSSSNAPTAAIRTFLQTPSSANLAAAVTDETGTGAIVFANNPVLSATVYSESGALVTKAAAATLTGAELLAQSQIRYTGAVANLTLPTGADLDAAILLDLGSALPVNRGFDFSVVVTGAGAATLVVAAGITSIGSLVVAAGASGLFRMRKTAADTFMIHRRA